MTDSKDKSRKINVDGEEATQKAAENKPETEATASEENTDAKTEETPEADPLEEAQKQIEELKDKYLRTVAEFDNYKKRTLKEKTELILNGGAKTVAAILPVLDDFERAIADKSDDPKAIKEGIQNIFNKFVKSLESLGVKQIETKDKDFDTDYHEAVALVPGMGDDKKGKVVDCLQTGYTMNDKVIRHAKVAVGQ
ncbi:nucleotide exchange factor GrpE [Hallella sp.]|uniref:nucleotide exchange factor GrpE n=1 Tax=Hallella sp. TaxID=2980186 RepID=UPI0030799A15